MEDSRASLAWNRDLVPKCGRKGGGGGEEEENNSKKKKYTDN